MNKGYAGLTAAALVGNEGKDPYTIEKEIAAAITQDTKLGMNDLLTKKDAIFKEMVDETNIDVVEELKKLLDYIEKDPRLVKQNVFSKVSEIMQQLNTSNIKTNEQAKTI